MTSPCLGRLSTGPPLVAMRSRGIACLSFVAMAYGALRFLHHTLIAKACAQTLSASRERRGELERPFVDPASADDPVDRKPGQMAPLEGQFIWGMAPDRWAGCRA